jgi:hypothetical protein
MKWKLLWCGEPCQGQNPVSKPEFVQDVELDDIMHYIDREIENRDSMPAGFRSPIDQKAKNNNVVVPTDVAVPAPETRTLSDPEKPEKGLEEEAEELLVSLNSGISVRSDQPPELPAEKNEASPPNRDLLIKVESDDDDLTSPQPTSARQDSSWKASPGKVPVTSVRASRFTCSLPLSHSGPVAHFLLVCAPCCNPLLMNPGGTKPGSNTLVGSSHSLTLNPKP